MKGFAKKCAATANPGTSQLAQAHPSSSALGPLFPLVTVPAAQEQYSKTDRSLHLRTHVTDITLRADKQEGL